MKDEELMRGVANAMREHLDVEARVGSGGAEGASSAVDPALNERLLQTVLNELGAGGETAAQQPPRLNAAAHKKRFAPRAWVFGAAGIAAAAAAVLFLTPASRLPLPSFESSLSGGERVFRSESAAQAVQLRADSNLEWVLRPEQPVSGTLVVHTFYQRAGHDIEHWKVTPDISEQGSVRIRGRVADLQLPGGMLKLIAVIADSQDMTADDDVRRKLADPDPRWRVVTDQLEIAR